MTMRAGELLVSVIPERGAKIEFLGRTDGPNVLYPSSFDARDDFGFADRFLTLNGAPDLGSIPWDVSREGNDLHCEVRCPDSPCVLRRHLSAAGNTLRLSYEIASESDRPMDVLWSAHPFLRITPGSRIVLPRSIAALTVAWSAEDRLGRRGARTTPPRRIGPAWAGTADKLYSDRLEEGFCAYLDRETGHTVEMRFDPDRIPYLGVRLSQGRPYSLALEPCLAPCDSLLTAIARGLGIHLGARDTYAFSFDLTIGSMKG